MKRYIAPCNIDKIITAPASKSYAQRAIILSLLAGGESHLTGFNPCDDTLAAIEVARQLGALIIVDGTTCTISSSYHPERYTPH
ncbi:MAG: 3-phosphoshikimate 1-carboxyvinyltransferase, partial [Rikenellaceae bacterium]